MPVPHSTPWLRLQSPLIEPDGPILRIPARNRRLCPPAASRPNGRRACSDAEGRVPCLSLPTLQLRSGHRGERAQPWTRCWSGRFGRKLLAGRAVLWRAVQWDRVRHRLGGWPHAAYFTACWTVAAARGTAVMALPSGLPPAGGVLAYNPAGCAFGALWCGAILVSHQEAGPCRRTDPGTASRDVQSRLGGRGNRIHERGLAAIGQAPGGDLPAAAVSLLVMSSGTLLRAERVDIRRAEKGRQDHPNS